jgi:hypothetical protein
VSDPRFDRAVERFEAAHREDPEGESFAYHQRVAHWVSVFAPEASTALALAARAQHIRRWTIPRSTYEDGRTGYKRWRSELARFHAEEAGRILREVGFDEETIARVASLLMKQRLKSDPEVQALEDAVCLVFLELQFTEFATKHDEAKLIDIVQKTWTKMSPAGHAAALELAGSLEGRARAILERALATPAT